MNKRNTSRKFTFTDRYPGKKSDVLDTIKDFALYVAIFMAINWVLFCCIFNLVKVEGNSMYPALKDGELLLMKDAFYAPARGDIVNCKPSADEEYIIKRLIALEGDTVEIDLQSGAVYVNGTLLREDYKCEEGAITSEASYPLVVPEGKAFVLGDNRNRSTDSRSSEIGFIDIKNIKSGFICKLIKK